MVSPSYNKLAKFVGGNSEFTTVKLDGVNCLIQIFLQTHNLQGIIFTIFSQQSSKMTSNKEKKKQLSSHLPQTGIKGFRISNLLSLSSQGVVESPF